MGSAFYFIVIVTMAALLLGEAMGACDNTTAQEILFKTCIQEEMDIFMDGFNKSQGQAAKDEYCDEHDDDTREAVEECRELVADCSETIRDIIRVNIATTDVKLREVCGVEDVMACYNKTVSCMGGLISKIENEGGSLDELIVKMEDVNKNQDELCKLIGDFDIATTVRCIMDVEGECLRDTTSGIMSPDDMHETISSLKHLCKPECANVSKKNNETLQCTKDNEQKYDDLVKAAEAGDADVADKCTAFKDAVSTCLKEKAECCPLTVKAIVEHLDDMIEDDDKVAESCPELGRSFRDICPKDGPGTDPNGGTTGAGTIFVPGTISSLLAIIAIVIV